MSDEYYHGLWRASANEGVPYTEDFPESLLVFPEWIDGALGAGEATEINIVFDLTNPLCCIVSMEDNGRGLMSEKRMKDWVSKEVGNDRKENMYGHGSKKALTKFAPDYHTAKWELYWRKQDKRGLSGSLHIVSSPFKGLDTTHEENEEKDDICPQHGTRWQVEFNKSVLGNVNTVSTLMESLQEIIRSRYEPSYYQPYQINIEIKNGTESIKQNSKHWKSLKQTLEEECTSGNVVKTHEKIIQIDGTIAKCTKFQIIADGRKYNIPGMKLFGRKNMDATRVHISRHGRYIEAMPFAKFMDKEIHNSDNGTIAFVQFEGELPTPCTTKVQFQYDCPIFKKMKGPIKEYFKTDPAKPPIPAKPSPAKPSPTKPSTKPVAKPTIQAKPPSSIQAKLDTETHTNVLTAVIQTTFHVDDIQTVQRLREKYGVQFNSLIQSALKS